MVQFWRELTNAACPPIIAPARGSTLTLANGALILGDAKLGSAIYIRAHYEALYQLIKRTLASSTKKGILVMGTPGIGACEADLRGAARGGRCRGVRTGE